jgi:hypothetical protein
MKTLGRRSALLAGLFVSLQLFLAMVGWPMQVALARASQPQTLAAPSGQSPITIVVDATEAPRKILHARLTIPIAKAGPLTLLCPKWIPGELLGLKGWCG